MTTHKSNPVTFSAYIRKHRTVILLVGLGVLLALLLSSRAYLNRPPVNLGPRLQYVGKYTTGCFFFCDSPRGSTYYFAANMTPNELARYFKHANCTIQGRTLLDGEGYVGGGLNCKLSGGRMWYPDYYYYADGNYDRENGVIRTDQLKVSNKPLIITVSDFDYSKAKAAL